MNKWMSKLVSEGVHVSVHVHIACVCLCMHLWTHACMPKYTCTFFFFNGCISNINVHCLIQIIIIQSLNDLTSEESERSDIATTSQPTKHLGQPCADDFTHLHFPSMSNILWKPSIDGNSSVCLVVVGRSWYLQSCTREVVSQAQQVQSCLFIHVMSQRMFTSQLQTVHLSNIKLNHWNTLNS